LAGSHISSLFSLTRFRTGGPSHAAMEQYRRVQLARYLIDADRCSEAQFSYDSNGRITAFGLDEETLQAVIDTGEPFRTSSCTGRDGEVACNRPSQIQDPEIIYAISRLFPTHRMLRIFVNK